VLISRLLSIRVPSADRTNSELFSTVVFVTCQNHRFLKPWKLNASRRHSGLNFLLLPLNFLVDAETRYTLIRKLKNLSPVKSNELGSEKIFVGCCMAAIESRGVGAKFIAARETFSADSREMIAIKLVLIDPKSGNVLGSWLNPGFTSFSTSARIRDRFLSMAMHSHDFTTRFETSMPTSSGKDLISYDFGLLTRKFFGKVLRLLSYIKSSWRLEVSHPGIKSGAWMGITFEPPIAAADPFLVSFNGAVECFFEGLEKRNSNGKIYSFRIDLTNPNSVVRKTQYSLSLDLGVHISFPFVFVDEATLFMICESSRLNSSFLFRFDEMERKWIFVSNVMPGRKLLDPIIIKLPTKYILVASERCQFDSYGSAVVKFFESEDLFSNWREIENFGIWDDRFVRCAGRQEGKLLFQDFESGIYGKTLRSLMFHGSESLPNTTDNCEIIFSSSWRKYHHFNELGTLKIRDSSRL
jgi:hypothetical protein